MPRPFPCSVDNLNPHQLLQEEVINEEVGYAMSTTEDGTEDEMYATEDVSEDEMYTMFLEIMNNTKETIKAVGFNQFCGSGSRGSGTFWPPGS